MYNLKCIKNNHVMVICRSNGIHKIRKPFICLTMEIRNVTKLIITEINVLALRLVKKKHAPTICERVKETTNVIGCNLIYNPPLGFNVDLQIDRFLVFRIHIVTFHSW